MGLDRSGVWQGSGHTWAGWSGGTACGSGRRLLKPQCGEPHIRKEMGWQKVGSARGESGRKLPGEGRHGPPPRTPNTWDVWPSGIVCLLNVCNSTRGLGEELHCGRGGTQVSVLRAVPPGTGTSGGEVGRKLGNREAAGPSPPGA